MKSFRSSGTRTRAPTDSRSASAPPKYCSSVSTLTALAPASSYASATSAAGVVADSDPAAEWQETRHKARALLAAAEQASGEAP